MAYNLSTVRENVRNRLDDADYEDTFLDRAINYAQWQITNKHHLSFLESSGTLTVNAGAYDAPLPADHHETLYLRLATPASMRADMTPNFRDYKIFVESFIDPASNPQGPPYHWSEYGRRVKLANPMEQNYTFAIDYLRKSPSLIEDEDVPDIPEEFQELLELGAYMRIAKREDDYDVKNQEQMDYQMLLTDLINVYGRSKGPGGVRSMRVAGRA